jgi:cellulose biosynthesis protein BcsQ
VDVGKIITFYSYKGGTGRTMALANVAVTLARERRAKVLMIDWDLEAPGLHRFFETDGDDAQQGLIDLFLAIREVLPGKADVSEGSDVISPQQFWEAVNVDGYITRTSTPELYLMRAGRFDENYPTRVNTFDWEGLYEKGPATFQSFAGALAEHFDYVLVDSRTGITDTSGICTMLLPERLVVVFTPNRQSLVGGLDLVRQAASYRRRSDDLRPLVVFPLASRVELSEEELRNEWRHGAEQGLKSTTPGYQPSFEHLFEEVYDLPRCDLDSYFDEIQVQHSPRFAYGEHIAVLLDNSRDRLSIARSYESFARVLADSDSPWTVKRTQTDSGDEPADVARRVVDSVTAQVRELQDHAPVYRMRRLLLRTTQAVLLLSATVGVVICLRSAGTEQYWVPIAVAGVFFVSAIEYLLRTAPSVTAGQKMAAAAAALARELRLYQACAGPYGAADRPAALLAERSEEVLMEITDAPFVQGVGSSPVEMLASGGGESRGGRDG